MLQQVKATLQTSKLTYSHWFPDLYYYYGFKLFSLGYYKEFSVVLHFPIFLEPYMQKLLSLYQLETVPIHIKDKNIEANSYTWPDNT